MTRDLCIMACVFCKDRQFWAWLNTRGINCDREVKAKAYILELCDIDSRNDLDTDTFAASMFHQHIRLPFMAWKEAQ